MHFSAALLFLLPCTALSVNVVPKTDFGEASPGINPEIVKTIIEKNLEPTVNPGVVKAVLEVNVGGLTSTKKPETKTADKDDKKKKKNQVLICTLDGNCKLHEIVDNNSKEDDVKKLKPIIVTDFNVDPSKEKKGVDGDKKEGKDVPDIPVFVGHKGAVRDDGFSYHAGHERLPVYYGMKLSPAFHQPYHPPGSVIYEEADRYPPTPGSYPRYPYEHDVGYLYANEEDEYPIEYQPYPHTYESSFSGHPGTRTPTPYGKFYTTSKPSYQGVITPLHRRAGGGDWSGTQGVYWSSPKSNEVPRHSGSGWVGSNSPGWSRPSTPGLVGSNNPGWGSPSTPGLIGSSSPGWSRPTIPGVVGSHRPGVYWPTEKPNVDYPSPGIITVRDKMDFDHVPVNGGGGNPTDPSNPGKGEITVDGKLGEPLDTENS